MRAYLQQVKGQLNSLYGNAKMELEVLICNY